MLDEVPREVIEDIVSAEGNGDGPLVELGDGRVVDAIDRFDGATLPIGSPQPSETPTPWPSTPTSRSWPT